MIFSFSGNSKKKAMIFNTIVLLVTFVALIWGYIIIQSKANLTKEPIGQKQFDLFHIYQRGERALIFTDSSARMSTSQAIYDFGKNGGFGDKSECDTYINSNLWQNKDKACFPDVLTEYTKMFEKVLAKILVTYDDASFPVSDYSFSYDSSGNIIGISKTFISFPVTGAGVGYIPTAPFVMPKNVEERLKLIDELYGQDIKNGIQQLNINDKIDYGTAIGLISQESAADPYAISPTGCAGLAQVCYCTAWAYTPSDFLPHSSCGGTKQDTVIFDKVTPCGCTGKTDPACKCNPSNDDRFDSGKSVKFILVYLDDELKHYSGYKAQLEFGLTAYNTGTAIVDAAIKRTGKSKDEVTLDDMTSQISSDLVINYISYYKDHPELALRQVNDARNYAKRILAYRQKYNEIMVPSQPEQASPPVAVFDLKSRIDPITGLVTFNFGNNAINNAYSKGTYNIYPSFRVNPNYDFSDYDQVKEGVAYISEQCADSEDAENCVLTLFNIIKQGTSSQDEETEPETDVSGILQQTPTSSIAPTHFFPSDIAGYPADFVKIPDDLTSSKIICDSGCVALPETVTKLYDIVPNIPQGYTVHFYASRTPARQMQLYKEYLSGRGNPACGPRGPINSPDSYLHCPHVTGRAIDVRLLKDGVTSGATKTEDLVKLKNMMCASGWANWVREYWHYEYLTGNYQEAKNRNSCMFGNLVKWKSYMTNLATVTPHYTDPENPDEGSQNTLAVNRERTTEPEQPSPLPSGATQSSSNGAAFDWSLGTCGSYPEKIFYDFAEKVNDCSNAKEDNCLCTFDFPKKTTNLPKDISISMANSDSNIGLLYKDKDNADNPQLSYTIPSKSIGIVNVVSGNPQYHDIIDSELKIKYAEKETDKISLYNTIKEFSYDSTDEKVYLFKKDGKLYFVDGDIVKNKKQVNFPELKKSCEPDRAFRICAVTNNKRYAYDPNDPNDNKLATRSIFVNFALNVPDTLAPALVQDTKVEGVPISENKVKITWKKNVEKDVYKYKIYYSYEKDFVNTKEEGVYVIEVSNDISESIISGMEGYDNTREKNILHVVVATVDYSGNEINDTGSDGNIDYIVVDTLRPKMSDGTVTATANGNAVAIKWQTPTKNEDNSTLEDLAGYRLYDSDTFIKNIDADKTEETLNGVASGEHTYKLEPLDETWKSADPALKSESNPITII